MDYALKQTKNTSFLCAFEVSKVWRMVKFQQMVEVPPSINRRRICIFVRVVS